jgi:hypothetical protein
VDDRAPPCGGIARPKGRHIHGYGVHSRRKRVLCLPTVGLQQELNSRIDEKGMKTRRVFARRTAHPVRGQPLRREKGPERADCREFCHENRQYMHSPRKISGITC